MLLIKAFHIAFMASWFAGLFFLTRLFIQQANTANSDYGKLMGAKLYFGIMTPSAILTVALGIGLIAYGYEGGWLPAKLVLVLILILFHLYCGTLMMDLARRRSRHSLSFYRLLNWFPLVLFGAIIALAAAKPVTLPLPDWWAAGGR